MPLLPDVVQAANDRLQTNRLAEYHHSTDIDNHPFSHWSQPVTAPIQWIWKVDTPLVNASFFPKKYFKSIKLKQNEIMLLHNIITLLIITDLAIFRIKQLQMFNRKSVQTCLYLKYWICPTKSSAVLVCFSCKVISYSTSGLPQHQKFKGQYGEGHGIFKYVMEHGEDNHHQMKKIRHSYKITKKWLSL